MRNVFFLVSVIALSSMGFAAQAATCGEMFNKAEMMVTEKASGPVAKKVKAYQMAIDSYAMCEKAMTMPSGDKKTAMMKDAEHSFERTYSLAREIE